MNTSRWGDAISWSKSHWPIIRKVAVGCFVTFIVILLGYAATHVDWNEVMAAIWTLSPRNLWIAGLITLASYMVYSTFDLLGKWYTDHGLAWWRAMMVGFISYAFTMSMGAPVGGVGLRLRLYRKQGLQPGVVMRVMALSIATNWIGYLLLAGSIFAAGGVRLPAEWELGNGAFRVIGVLMVTAALAYLILCAFSRTRSWTIRGHEIELPTIGLAAVQVCVAMLNWTLMGAVIYLLMQQKIEFMLVLGTLLVSAIAGAVAHVPAGLGVTESVFIALLASESMPQSQMLGALLVYRAVYYIIPLFVAGVWYLGVEARMEGPDTMTDGSGSKSPTS